MEVVKAKAASAEEEVQKLNKVNQGLRDVISRLEREKVMLDGRAKTAAREAQVNLKSAMIITLPCDICQFESMINFSIEKVYDIS